MDWGTKLFNGTIFPKDHPAFHKFLLMAALITEAIWMERRNSIVHGNPPKRPEMIFLSAMTAFSSYSSVLLCHQLDRPTTWATLPFPWIKINVDAAVRAHDAVKIAVARDDSGRVLALKATTSHNPDPIVAEALALLLGLEHAKLILGLLSSWNQIVKFWSTAGMAMARFRGKLRISYSKCMLSSLLFLI
ncbi:hypothetical protein PanWU01x14_194870 [Parasponia andersonii]|uniref:RNase H type-1 domain-containing protein n=1 Tax=Parasponia andersonii TaxID=3476 RepID=A0A2P5C035_PARAD|nr:hypothetical protein PanWU01x14_194870 [Parasponia andersonii]